MPVERIHFWGISAVALFYVLAGIAVAIFLAGVWLRVSAWRAGRREDRGRRVAGHTDATTTGARGAATEMGGRTRREAARAAAAGLGRVGLDGLLGRRIFKGDPLAGLMHTLIMWGFAGLFVGTVLATVDHWFVHFLTGDTYLVYSLCLEIFGLMLTAGVLIALLRRYVLRVPRLENRAQDLWLLLLLFVCVVSGFVVEGTRLAAETPAWEGHSFTGLGLASWLPSGAGAEAFYPYIWWFHATISLALIAYFPFSKLFHSLAAPVNTYLSPRRLRPAFGGPDDGFSPGDEADADASPDPRFTFRDLVAFSACTRCGRCDEVCPSTSAAEPFSPRQFLAQAGAFTGAGELTRARLEAAAPAWIKRLRDSPAQETSATLRISPEQIWYCTTCRACLEVCPVYIGALEPISRVRTAEIEDGSRISSLLINALETLYRFHNPWEPSKRKRSEWSAGLTITDGAGMVTPVTVPDLTESAAAGGGTMAGGATATAEATGGAYTADGATALGATAGSSGAAPLCYWVGCTTSIDTRTQKLARAFVRILAHTGVGFATFGQKETCCGDIARRIGERGLFEEQVEKTTALFAGYGVTDVVTSSPHCFNLFKNEYSWTAPAPGADGRAGGPAGPPVRARHYTELLEELLEAGRLRPAGPLDLRVTYHDPCYLGRYNQIYDAPRKLIRSIPGVSLVEMAHSGSGSLCCGGGGGRMWQELADEKKLSEVRIREAAATGAEIVVTACPYCLIMLEDAVKTADLEGGLEVMDLNELLAQSLGLAEDGD